MLALCLNDRLHECVAQLHLSIPENKQYHICEDASHLQMRVLAPGISQQEVESQSGLRVQV